MNTGRRFQIRFSLLLLVGVCLVAVPLMLELSRSRDQAHSVSQDARELAEAFNRRSNMVGDGDLEESLAIARAQLDAFAVRSESGSEAGNLSVLGLGCVVVGIGLVIFSLYQVIRYIRQVDGDLERLLSHFSDDASRNSEESGKCIGTGFRELESLLLNRMSSFEDWIERLNNERTDALTDLEKERFSLLEKLSQKSKSARSAVHLSARKGDFLATMSHEIRTPMNGVLAVADDLLSYDLDHEIAEKVEMIKLSGESLVRILDDVLDFSKIEAGKLDVRHQSFDFIFACNATHSLFRALAKEKGLRYELFIDSEVPQFIVGDSVRVRQVIANLLSNALKFTEEGGVTLSIAKQNRESEGLLLSVADTGMGIDSEAFDRLFEAFGQAETGLEEKGTGLGLAISKRLASLMDGDLSYSENHPTGSVFDFWIPFVEGTPVVELDEMARSDEVVENARILIVEDNRINQHVIESLLERAKHEVYVASNGLEALDQIEEHDFDLIFMDCLMPKLDGFETARRIRALPPEHSNQATPIIALTANAFAHDRDMCFEAGMDDFLAKPVKKDTLLRAVNHHCRARTS